MQSEEQQQEEEQYFPEMSSASINTNWAEKSAELGVIEVAETFDEMKLNTQLQHGIYSHGFERPSFIQQRGILAVSSGQHIIAQAQSGTGKTATFCVGTLNRVDLSLKKCQVLVMAPTRELANQIFNVYNSIGLHMKKNGLTIAACVGGTHVGIISKELRAGPHVVVGTPGRVRHMIESGDLNLSSLKSFVLDEADEMLSRGFMLQIHEVLNSIEHPFQVCLFSATLEPETLKMADEFMPDPIKILVKKDAVTLEGIVQFYISLREEWKVDVLNDIFSNIDIQQSIIYCNTRNKVEWLAKRMTEDDFTVSSMHGEMEDAQRRKIMAEFREGKSRVLITTDLTSRGIDVQGVSTVINYDLPKYKETYIHRIGRSGRFGRKGMAINFVVANPEGQPPSDEMNMMKEIEEYYGTDLTELNAEEIKNVDQEATNDNEKDE